MDGRFFSVDRVELRGGKSLQELAPRQRSLAVNHRPQLILTRRARAGDVGERCSGPARYDAPHAHAWWTRVEHGDGQPHRSRTGDKGAVRLLRCGRLGRHPRGPWDLAGGRAQGAYCGALVTAAGGGPRHPCDARFGADLVHVLIAANGNLIEPGHRGDGLSRKRGRARPAVCDRGPPPVTTLANDTRWAPARPRPART